MSPRTLSLLALAAVACGPSYMYRPTEQVSATVAGRAASRYAIPPEAPRGEVRVTTFGLVDLRVNHDEEDGDDYDDDDEVRFLLVRMVVSNDGGVAPWMVDTRRQILELPGEGRSRPAYASTDVGGRLPVVVVQPTQKRVLDLYYPLPEDSQHAREIPEFDLLWSVQTDQRVVTQRTPFERVEVEPQTVAYPSMAVGFGPYWWYDPFYPSYTFSRPVIIHHHHGRHHR